MSEEIRLAFAGYGTVGKALHRIIEERNDAFERDEGFRFRVVAVARRDRYIVDADGLATATIRTGSWTSGDAIAMLGECEADVLMEMSPTDLDTAQPALGHCRYAFREGMHVVLANKGPVVRAPDELHQRAADAGVQVRHEATVAGCIPTLSTARHGFAGDTVRRIEGVLNGTTNFILTRMAEEGSDLDQALREAQSLGYAEADPTNDLDGFDAAAKVVILANSVLGREITMDDVEVRGIRDITRQAVELAKAHGYRIRLIAEADREGIARVGPRLVPAGSSLDVKGALNAVRFTTDLAGHVTLTGAGAGGMETAAAMLSDLMGLARVGKARRVERAKA